MIQPFAKQLPGILSISEMARTTNIVNSCALGMALVAAGKSNVIIEPPQRPWDFAAGRALIEDAGGVVLFYRIDRERPVRVEAPTERDFDPENRALGFVAGHSDIAEEVISHFSAYSIW